MITHLVLSGGNIYALPYLGVIRYIYTHNLQQNIKFIAGTSFGAIISTCYAIKASTEDIENFFIKHFNDKELINFNSKNVINLLPKCGLESPYKHLKYLNYYILEKYNKNITFLDIAKTNGINLYINAFCINTQKDFVFSVETTPNISIIDAVAASIAIPFMFQPVEIDGYYYCDSCFVNNILTSYFSNINPKNILSVFTKIPIHFDEISQHTKIDFLTFSSIIMKISLNSIFEFSSHKHINYENSIVIDDNNDISIKMNTHNIYYQISTDLIHKAILYGYIKTQRFFDNYYQTIGSSSPPKSTDVV
jgi:predicted acylesterase/phospholipase RssA